jgi:hypothetical protein
MESLFSRPKRKLRSRTIPFGYKVSEEEDKTLDAVPEELEALKEAEQYLENCSYQEVATWVTNKTGRAITGMGLRKVLKRGW